MCASTQTLQQRSQGPPCPKSHCAPALETNPTAQAQHCSAPRCVGRGEAGHPSHWGTYCREGRLTQTCPAHRRARPQRSPNWYRGNQPRKETKWLHLIFHFILLSLLSLLLHIGNKGSSKAKSISKLYHHVSILAKTSYRVQLLHLRNKIVAV